MGLERVTLLSACQKSSQVQQSYTVVHYTPNIRAKSSERKQKKLHMKNGTETYLANFDLISGVELLLGDKIANHFTISFASLRLFSLYAIQMMTLRELFLSLTFAHSNSLTLLSRFGSKIG